MTDCDLPDSTEEMKNMESRQAAATLLQIKNHDPSKFTVIKSENEPQIIFNSVSGLLMERATENLHRNPMLDILFDKAVSQRLSEESHIKSSPKSQNDEYYYNTNQYNVQLCRPDVQLDLSLRHDPNHSNKPKLSRHSEDEPNSEKEMDLSTSKKIKLDMAFESNSAEEADESEGERYNGNSRQIDLSMRSNEREDGQKMECGDLSIPYDEVSQSSSGSDPERLQMDIAQVYFLI